MTVSKILWLPCLKDEQGKKLSLSMLLYLPGERDGLKNLIDRAISDANFFDKYCPTFRVWVRKLKLPEFEISWSFLSLVFKHISLKWPNWMYGCDQKPYLGQVVHKVIIEIEEKGTTATAATVITYPTMVISAGFVYRPFFEFVAVCHQRR